MVAPTTQRRGSFIGAMFFLRMLSIYSDAMSDVILSYVRWIFDLEYHSRTICVEYMAQLEIGCHLGNKSLPVQLVNTFERYM